MIKMVDVQAILKKIENLASLSDYPLEDFADEEKDADKLAQFFVEQDKKLKKDRLKPTQLRKVFHALKEVERKYKGKNGEDFFEISDILSLKPELAYAVGRELIPQEFYRLMKTCLTSEKLKKVNDFRRLMEFLTAVLAYHKFRKGIRPSSS